MSEPHGPIWIVNAPAPSHPDGRSDTIPTPLPVFSAPVLDPQQVINNWAERKWKEKKLSYLWQPSDEAELIEMVSRLSASQQQQQAPNDVIADAAPARQADEDAERLTNLLYCIAKGVTYRSDAVWLREQLIGWLQIIDALEKMQL